MVTRGGRSGPKMSIFGDALFEWPLMHFSSTFDPLFQYFARFSSKNLCDGFFFYVSFQAAVLQLH